MAYGRASASDKVHRVNLRFAHLCFEHSHRAHWHRRPGDRLASRRAGRRPATASSFRLLHSSSCRAGKPQDPRSRRARAHAPVRSVRAHRVRTRRVRSSQCRAKPAVPAAMRRLCSWARLQLQFVAKRFVHELRF